jgi:hypothetical protein
MNTENENTETVGAEGAEGAEAAEGTEPAPIKKGRGRPKKTEKSESELPLTREPLPREKKTAEEYKDPGAAIRRYFDNIATCMAAYAELHPESDLSWVWKEARTRLPPERDRIGAPMAQSAFMAPVVGLCKLGGMIGDLDESEMPTPAEYERVTDSWARASTHLGMTEKMAALVSAGSETVGVVVFTMARGVHRWLGGAPKKKAKPEVDGDARPAPTKEAAPVVGFAPDR